jgi:hypothetical protein
MIDKGAIFSADGTSCWASSSGFVVRFLRIPYTQEQRTCGERILKLRRKTRCRKIKETLEMTFQVSARFEVTHETQIPAGVLQDGHGDA